MTTSQIAGVGLLIVGAILLALGLRATDAPIEQLSNALTGRYTDRTMWYLVAGASGLVVGALLTLFGRRRA
jgi:hypothetical protein